MAKSSTIPRRLPTPVVASDIVGRLLEEDAVSLMGANFSFDIETSIKNGLPYPVSVTLRNGVVVELPPIAEDVRFHKNLVIYVRYRYKHGVKFDKRHILDNPDNMELKALQKSIESSRTIAMYNYRDCTIEYHLTHHDFECAGGAVHMSQLDMSFSVDDWGSIVVHPYSDEGRRIAIEESDIGFQYRIDIVDPDNIFGDRFININGTVYRIKRKQGGSRAAGVYLTHTGTIDGVDRYDYYVSFAEADKQLNLYTTAHEAETLGNADAVYKREIERSQQQLKMEVLQRESELKLAASHMEERLMKLKADHTEREHQLSALQSELKQMQLRQEQLAKERDAAIASEKATREHKLAMEKSLREAEMAKLKDEYDLRSHERKDTSEIVKYLPGIVVAVGLIAAKFLN